ncbi:hypothetical protein [Frankia sp. QA3]|uniref:hypothetical protein n=1 Tax=Frankia sp. QA3 TaxID=710111 RepID=UPI0003020752|nr:hypothetical protein [Frankia sp. QA3]
MHDYERAGLLPRAVDVEDSVGQLNTCYEFVRVADDGSRFVPYEPSLRCGARLDR